MTKHLSLRYGAFSISFDNNFIFRCIPQDNVFKLSDLKDVPGFFAQFGDEVPSIPVTNRGLEELLDDVYGDIWKLSREERNKLHTLWTRECKEQFYQSQVA